MVPVSGVLKKVEEFYLGSPGGLVSQRTLGSLGNIHTIF